MPPRPRPVTYAEAMAALLNTYRVIRGALKFKMDRRAKVQLQFLSTDLEILLRRDDGKRR